MDLTFTEEQSILRDSVSSYLSASYGFEKRREVIKGTQGWCAETWKFLAQDLGLLGASFPEELGGFGGGAIESMILAEEFGKVLLLEPFIETAVIGGGFLKHAENATAAEWIEKLIAGELMLAFAQAERDSRYSLNVVDTRAKKTAAGWELSGKKRMVMGAPLAHKFIVSARTAGETHDEQGISLFLVDATAKGVNLDTYKTYDDRLAANISLQGTVVGTEALIGEEDNGLPLIERVMCEAIAATCAEANGVISQLLARTLEYTQDRKQFGKPLASFQVLQHRMVDMFMAAEQSTSMAWLASIRVAEADAQQRRYACSAAKAFISKACKQVGQSAIQLHGGMGLSEEMAISHYFKRATVLEQLFGSADYHLSQIERINDTLS